MSAAEQSPENDAIAWLTKVSDVCAEVAEERFHQQTKWGEQNHPNGTGGEPGVEPFGYCDAADLADWMAHPEPGTLADFARHRCEVMFSQGQGTYEAILTEEWGEALSEPDPVALRAELIQVAAVAVAWVEKIDRDLSIPPAHNCANYAAPVTCLTAPSSVTGRCDHCKEQA